MPLQRYNTRCSPHCGHCRRRGRGASQADEHGGEERVAECILGTQALLVLYGYCVVYRFRADNVIRCMRGRQARLLGRARHRAEASARRGSRLVTGDGTRYSHGAPVVLPQHSRGCRCSTEARSPGYSSVQAQWWLGSSEWSEPWLPAPSGLASLWTPRAAASCSQSAPPICCDQALMPTRGQRRIRAALSRE